jgi:hypothetical protein
MVSEREVASVAQNRGRIASAMTSKIASYESSGWEFKRILSYDTENSTEIYILMLFEKVNN